MRALSADTGGRDGGDDYDRTPCPPVTEPAETRKTVGVLGAAFLGVGAMVGAGIFALLGAAGAVAGSAVWLSFLIAGVIAGLLGHITARLGIRYPSSGGIVAYLMQGFGRGHVSGVSSWLFYFAGLIVTAMVAVSFGSYGASLFFGDDAAAGWVNALASAVVVAMAAINVVGAGAVAKVQSLIVVVLLLVFAVFIAVTLADADWDLLASSTYPPLRDIVASVALTFFAYLGFAVISFTAADMRNPRRELPRAMYIGIGVAAGIYVLVSLGTFGALTPDDVARYGDTALAHAAEPSLGDAGFTMMALAALLATSSSVNANVFAAGSITAMLAREQQFPRLFGGRSWFGAPNGLVISAALVLVLANAFDLAAIADIGSAVAMVIFLLLGIAAFRLRATTGTSGMLVLVTLALTSVVLVLFAVDTLENDPGTFVAMVVIAALALLLDFVWSRVRQRQRPAQAEAAG
jgi:amino acid transporter